MIQINLLPHDLRPVKRTPLPYILSVLLLLLAVAVIATVHLGVVAEVGAQQAQLDENRRRLDALQPIVDEANELTLKKQQLAARIETINEIVSDRIIWSRQLWNLARLAPENVWFSSFLTDTRRVQREVRERNAQGQMETRRINVQEAVFRVSGYVIDGPDGSRTVSPLISAIEADDEFSSVFTHSSTEFGDTVFEGYPVRQFALDFTIGSGAEAR